MNPEVLHATALAISCVLKKRFAIRPAYGSAIALENCEITLTSQIMFKSSKQNDWMSYNCMVLGSGNESLVIIVVKLVVVEI